MSQRPDVRRPGGMPAGPWWGQPDARSRGSAAPAGQRGRPAAESNVTRLLCAGVQLDPKFCGAVIEELVKQGHRRTAPAYGYDCVPVLAHALNARDRRRIRNRALLAGVLVLLGLSVVDVAGLGAEWFALALWWAWAVLVVERVAAVHVLISTLKRTPGAPHDARLPWHRTLDRYARKIAVEQRQPPVYYSGYVPFVGAGRLSRSWSFSVALRAANPAAPPGDFTPEELVDHVCRQVVDQLQVRVHPSRRIDGLTASVRFYSTLLRPSGFDASTAAADDPRGPGGPGGPMEGYGTARRYACISISSWDQELVTSIFVGFDIRGDTLHTELHSYVLPPIKAEYHEVDRLPDRLGVPEVLAIAATSPVGALYRAVLRRDRGSGAARSRAPGSPSLIVVVGFVLAFLPSILLSLFLLSGFDPRRMVWFVLGSLALWLGPPVLGRVSRFVRRRMAERNAARLRVRTELAGSSGRTIVDYGARTSIRELAASDGPHHFFQSTDQDKYTKIIERRVTDYILDFLRARNVDVGEFERRQQVVLNYGIMQTGDGQIVNSGSMATGASTATTTTTTATTTPTTTTTR